MDEQLLTLHEVLALDRLEDFVRQAEARGVELTSGSDLERALVLLIPAKGRGRIALSWLRSWINDTRVAKLIPCASFFLGISGD
jgi:hypothetical protein